MQHIMGTQATEVENQEEKKIKEFLKLSLKTLTLYLLFEFLTYITCVTKANNRSCKPKSFLKIRFIN